MRRWIRGCGRHFAALGLAGGAGEGGAGEHKPYSEVTQPRPELWSQLGTPCSMVALQRTRGVAGIR